MASRFVLTLLLICAVNSALSQSFLFANKNELWEWKDDTARKVLTTRWRIEQVRIDREKALLYVKDSLGLFYRLRIPTLTKLDQGYRFSAEFNNLPNQLELQNQNRFNPDRTKYVKFGWSDITIFNNEKQLLQQVKSDIVLNTFFWINKDDLIICDYKSMFRLNSVTGEISKISDLPGYDGEFSFNQTRDSIYYVSSYINNILKFGVAPLSNILFEQKEYKLTESYSSFRMIGLQDQNINNVILYQDDKLFRRKDSLVQLGQLGGSILRTSKILNNEILALVESKSNMETEKLKVIRYNLNAQKVIAEHSIDVSNIVFFFNEPSDWNEISAPIAPQPKLEIIHQNQFDVSSIHFSTNGNYFITYDEQMTLWDARSLRQIRNIDCKNDVFFIGDIQISEELNQISCFCKNENSVTGEMRLYDLKNGTLLDKIKRADQYVIKGFDLENDKLFIEKDYKTYQSKIKDDSDWSVELASLDHIRFNEQAGIYSGRSEKGIQLLDKNGKTLLHIKRNKSFEYIREYELSKDGKFLLLVYPFNGSPFEKDSKAICEVYSVESGSLLYSQNLNFGLIQAKISLDSKHLFYLSYSSLENEDGNNYIGIFDWDIYSGKTRLLHAFDPGIKDAPITIGLLPNGKELIYSNHDLLHKIELISGKELMVSPQGISDENTYIDINRKTGHIYTALYDQVYDLDVQSPNNLKFFEEKTKLNHPWISLGNGKYLITVSENETEKGFVFNFLVKDLNQGNQNWSLAIENSIIESGVALPNNQLLLSQYYEGVYSLALYDITSQKCLHKYDLKNGLSPSVWVKRFHFSKDSSLLYLPVSNKKNERLCLILDIQGKIIEKGQIDNALLVLPTKNKNEIVILYNDPSKRFNSLYVLYDVQEGKSIQTIANIYGSSTLSFIDDQDEFLFVADNETMYKLSLRENNLPLKSFRHGYSYPSGVQQLNSQTYLLYDNNTAKIFDQKTDSLCYSFTVSKNSNFILQSPDGYYYTPLLGDLKFVSFTYEGVAFPFDELDAQYNRPDLVMKSMGAQNKPLVELYYKAYLQRNKRLGYKTSNTSISNKPRLMVKLEDLAVRSTVETLSIPFSIAQHSNQISTIDIWINNVHLRSIPYTGQTKVPIQLSVGNNRIQMSCKDEQGNQSLRETFQIYYEPSTKPPSKRIVITMACSKYVDSNFNLKYATKDAEDIHTIFQGSGEETIHYSFNNEKAIKSSISVIDSIIQATSIHDELIIFLSGHGLLDQQNDWWFATHDVHFKNPENNGIAFIEFDRLLENAPARKKLMLIDACNSGEFDAEIEYDNTANTLKDDKLTQQEFKGVSFRDIKQKQLKSSFEIMKDVFLDISKGSGAHIIAAASGNSYAYESDEFQNGIFTYALQTGLAKGFADSNKDGSISVLELKKYVEENVALITKGKQRPTARQENLENNFYLKE